MARMDRPSCLHPRGRYAHRFTVNSFLTVHSSDSPNAPLRFILSGQEDTRFHAGLFHAINNSVSVHHGLRIVQIYGYVGFTGPVLSQNNHRHFHHSHANTFAKWWNVLLSNEHRLEFLHVLDTSARV